MAEDTRTSDILGQSLAVEDISQARPLNKGDLQQIEESLGKFEKAIEQDENQPNAACHCLILAGYLGSGYKLPTGKETEEYTEEAVVRVCQERSRSHGPAERIDVILESRGGSLDSAFRTVLFLRKFAKEIRVHVPHRAKSAATLIAIGADHLSMSRFGELGPLDTQIADPRSPTTLVSALDCYRSVDYVRDFGLESISVALQVMLDKTQRVIPISQLIDLATNFATGNVKPMLDQVKALDFGGWGRTLKIGETYAKALRLRRNDPGPEADAARLARMLVYGYPHHPYPIDMTEAESLGLIVSQMSEEAYTAAKAVVDACTGNARFVGFSLDATDAIRQLGDRNVGGNAATSSTPSEESPQAVDGVDKPRGG